MSLINEVCYKYDKDKVENLFKEYYNGNKTLENDLILYNYTLIKRIISSVNLYNYFDYEELEGEALIALIYAIRNYDSSLGYSFSTYATTCIKNKVFNYIQKNKSKINTISLDSVIKGTEDIKIEEMIVTEEDCFSNYLQNDYINSLFINIPIKYKSIAHKYFIQNISIYDLQNIYNYNSNQLTNILKKCKNTLIKAIEESKLTDKEIIINRYNELEEKTKKSLLLYLQGNNYKEIGNKMNMTHASYLVKKGINHINYPLEQIKDTILNYNITPKEDINKDLLILNNILNLNDKVRNCLILSLKGYTRNEIIELMQVSYGYISASLCKAIKTIGFTTSEIKDCLLKYNILDNYTLEPSTTLDIAKVIFKNTNNYSKEYIKDIIDKFNNLPKEEQECIIDYINKATNDEMINKYNLTFGQVKRDMQRKMDKLGATKEEIRYCLAKHI